MLKSIFHLFLKHYFYFFFIILFQLELNVFAQTMNDGKRLIVLVPVDSLDIEMPDRSIQSFGEAFQARLITHLTQTGRYTVVDLFSPIVDSMSASEMNQNIDPYQDGYHQDDFHQDDFQWNSSKTPTATVKVQVEALSFTTGLKGEKSFYGFDERFKTPFHEDRTISHNEFPTRLFSMREPSWFGDSFAAQGVAPLDSRTGLDLGDGFSFDFLMAWLNVKYAHYHSELHLKLVIQSPLASQPRIQVITVQGDGFFFDVVAGYQNYSGALSVARNDAMAQAINYAIDGSLVAIEQVFSRLPLMARLDAILPDGTILLGTGINSQVQPGVLFSKVDTHGEPPVILKVFNSETNGSEAKVVSGDASKLQSGDLYKQVQQQIQQENNSQQANKQEENNEENNNENSTLATTDVAMSDPSLSNQSISELKISEIMTETEDGPVSIASVQLPTLNLPASSLGNLMPIITRAEAILKSLSDFVFLPYRIWRYFQYDQSYHTKADGGGENTSWNFTLEPWAKAVGLTSLTKPDQSPEVLVALIDSGMDYNHPILHSHLWLNPNYWIDPQGRKDQYGWDFFSGDSRPFDDGYHGTQIASVIAGVNPHVKLMPLKIFNPWGMTSSAAIEAAFVYAVNHGAQVIVCAWATWIRSHALEQAVAYAQKHGVVVVTSGGDGGVDLAASPTYPSHYARQFTTLLTVTAVDAQDRLLGDVPADVGEGQSRKANYSASEVQIGAPGVEIPVAEPRAEMQRASSSGLATAFVAGALTRYWEAGQSAEQWIDALLNDADVIPQLRTAIAGGRRVHVRR